MYQQEPVRFFGFQVLSGRTFDDAVCEALSGALA